MAESKLEQKPEASQQQAAKPAPQPTLAEVLAQKQALMQGRLAENVSDVELALEGQTAAFIGKQQEQTYATTVATWAAVLATVERNSRLEKEHEQLRAIQAMQEQMLELLAKEREKEKAKLRESAVFAPLVGLLGHATVESITQKIEAASLASGSAKQTAQAQLAKDIAAVLQSSTTHLQTTIVGEQLAKALEGEITHAVGALPTTARPPLYVVRAEEALARKAHEAISTLATGEERLVELKKMRGELGAEKFSVMVDAYDKKYGVPLAVHIAVVSSSVSTTQSAMLNEMKSALQPAQAQRVTEFGRAEFAQALAVLDKQRETAGRQIKGIHAGMRDAEKHLAAALGRPELKDLPADEIRAKLLEEIVKHFPDLKGLTFEGVALQLKELAGEKDDATALKLLQELSGEPRLKDPEVLRELATRTTLHLQKMLVLDQQLEAAKNATSTNETGDEALLRKHYSSVFGADATKQTPEFSQLKRSAASYMHHLEQHIVDASLSIEARDRLIKERDVFDLGYTKKLVAEALTREVPDPRRAVSILRGFSAAHVDSEFRRGAQVLEVARSLTEAIENADALRHEWQGLAGELFTNTRKTEFEVLASQREAALSTKWFSQILETRLSPEKGLASPLSVENGKDAKAMEARLERLDGARSGMDAANIRSRIALGGVEGEPVNVFLTAENLSRLDTPLKPETLRKLGTVSGAEAVAKVSRELDPNKELLVDKEVLENLRRAVDPKSEIGRALLACPPLPGDPETEIQILKSRLSLEDGVRLDTFVAVEQHLLASGKPSEASGILHMIAEAPIEALAGALKESVNEARISRLERLLGALTDEEHQEFLGFFEATTRQSVGQALLQGVPVSEHRKDVLVRLAESRNLTAVDIQRLLNEPVPADRAARAAALAQALEADTKRPPVNEIAVREAAAKYGYEYTTLRAAATVAAAQGRADLVGEITDKMREQESHVNGAVAKIVYNVDSKYQVRQGVKQSLRGAAEDVYASHAEKVYSNKSVVASTAREVTALLRPETPNSDAAFNRIRQANLSEEESLYLRALYSQESSIVTLGEGARSLSGNLAKDLEPLGTVSQIEKERIACLVKGGKEALLQADLRTLELAEQARDAKRQLETLANLRATGQYEQAKTEIEKKTLQPAAAEYHKAVTSGDKVKADTADITQKAKNGDLKPEEVARFLKDKKPEDYARINQQNPDLMGQIKSSNPTMFGRGSEGLLSSVEAERKRALEQVMLNSLTDPVLFGELLSVPPNHEARVQLLRNLEALVEKQPNAPLFTDRNESKIVQYVRAQKSDFREIDGHLIKSIIVVTLSTGEPLKPEIVERLRTLREQAAVQLGSMDRYHDIRSGILTSAREVLKGIEGYQLWASGSPELRRLEIGTVEWMTGSQAAQQKEAARAKIFAEIRERYPELKGRTDKQIEFGESGTRQHWRSGYLLDNPIALTTQRIQAQRQLVLPMEAGVRDIAQSRELVRAGFALMAKDAVAEVYRGLSPEATESVMTLLQQRDRKVTYRVTDEKGQREWNEVVENAQKFLDSKDRWTNIGLATAKVGVVLAVSVACPVAGSGLWSYVAPGLLAATAWNACDKAYRRAMVGEDWGSLGKSFAFELAVDVFFCKLAFRSYDVTGVGGQAAKKVGAEGIEVSKRIVEAFWKRWFSKGSVSNVFKSPWIGRADRLAAEMPKIIKEVTAEYEEKVIAKIGAEAYDWGSKWLQISAKERIWFLTVPITKSTPSNPTLPPKEELGDAGREKEVKQPHPTVGAQKPKVEEPDYQFVVSPTKTPEVVGPPPAPAQLQTTPPPSLAATVAEITIEDLFGPQSERASLLAVVDRNEIANQNSPTQTSGVSSDLINPAPANSTLSGSNEVKGEAATFDRGGPKPPSQPPSTGAGGGTPPGDDKPPGSAPGGGANGDDPGRGILVGPSVQVSAGGNGDTSGKGNATNASNVAGVGTENSNAAGHRGLQPVMHAAPSAHSTVVGSSIAQPEVRPQSMPGIVPQALTIATPVSEATRIELSMDVLTTPMSRPVLQSSGMHDPFKSETEGERTAVKVEEHRTVPNPPRQTHVTSKKDLADDDFIFVVHKKEKIGMKERPAVEKLAEGVEERREEEKTATSKNQAAKSEESLRNVSRVSAATSVGNIEPIAMREDQQREQPIEVPVANASASSVTPAQPAVITPTAQEALPASPVQTPVELRATATTFSDSGEDFPGAPAPKRSRKARTPQEDARMRQVLLQQLISHHVTKVQREKLLKALIALGISEVEYRKLVAKLGEMDTARLAQQQADRKKFAEPIAIANDVPEMKPTVEPLKEGSRPAPTPKTQTTRAQLYQRLKEEAETSRKRAG